ncbi:succinate dehydrogenase, hydrophobic membrane anchor protein [Sphingomonas sp.]|uniref:succinate dehydrogenase, hydrophobic membrane anchor protein n=1 Tax=Sphingomonas sp. TaxID=28214 RepID=UPI001DF21C39|nr:succinate dehydrogenase, hydrophobic membrane anchor protein [Sphingomonas sp.]MBX9795297.1 succinate dehydrogenase, hydrophobic membrane anchor protein [Sphingomonas sp.]
MGTGTQIGRVRGLGASKQGPHHWWHQRLTAGGNIVLMAWLLAAIALLPGHDRTAVVAWLSSPWAAIPMLLLVYSVLYHARLGLQVLLEDYLHGPWGKAMLVLLNFATIGAGATALFSILKIAFGGTAA